MNANETTLHTFYKAFQNRDYKTMQACYADDAVFNDEAFRNLSSAQVKGMWEMLCKNGKELTIQYKNVQADDKAGSAEWVAWYLFSATGNNVENRIKANFTFQDGKIVTHTDQFNFYRWARQAFGVTGWVLGWTPFFKNKVQQRAAANLDAFMKRGWSGS